MHRNDKDRKKDLDPRRSGRRLETGPYEDERREREGRPRVPTPTQNVISAGPGPRSTEDRPREVTTYHNPGGSAPTGSGSQVAQEYGRPGPSNNPRPVQTTPVATAGPAGNGPVVTSHGPYSSNTGAQGSLSNAAGKRPERTLPPTWSTIRSTDFKPRDFPGEDFQRGAVFEWLIPANVTSGASMVTADNTKFERFVVIEPGKKGQPNFFALSISTYNGQGVGKDGVVKHHHVIVYATPYAPDPAPEELPQRDRSGSGAEYAMQRQPIRIRPNDGFGLTPMARLNYAEIHEFEPGVRVRMFGRVHRDSAEDYYRQYQLVWQRMKPFPRHKHRAPESRPYQQGTRPFQQTTGTTLGDQSHGTSPGSSAAASSMEDGLTDLRRRFDQIKLIGDEKRLPVPEFPKGTLRMELAQDRNLRDRYVKKINDDWKDILEDRARRQGRSSDSDEEDYSERDDATVRGPRRSSRR